MTVPQPDAVAAGTPFVAGGVIVQALRDSPLLTTARVLDNPVRASDLQDGSRIVFFEDSFDRPRGNPGQLQQRTYGFTLGVISRASSAAGARAAAHADYRIAKRVLRLACMPALTAAGVRIDGAGISEGEVRYRLENIDVGGSLVLADFTLEYRDPS